MVFHAVYNGLAVTLGSFETLPGPLEGAAGWGVSAVLLALGAALVRRGSAQADDAPGDGAPAGLQMDEVDAGRRR